MLSLACRLVKGDGEVLEEIVSREQQRAINKVCTMHIITINVCMQTVRLPVIVFYVLCHASQHILLQGYISLLPRKRMFQILMH